MYLSMYITLLSLSFYETFKEMEDKLKRNLFIIFNLVLIVIASLRYYIGTDYGTYVEIFNGINKINDYSYLEIGFRLIIILIKLISNNSNLLFIVMAFISIFYFYEGVKNSSKKPLVSIFIYFNIFYIAYIFNAMRQGFAMSVFLYSLKYYEENDLKNIIILTLIGCSIHYSTGICILIAYTLRNIKIDKKLYVYILILGIVFCLFNPLKEIIMNIPILGIKEKFMVYSQFSEKISIIDILQRITILIIFMINVDEFGNDEIKIFNVYIWGWILYCILSFNGTVATRINMFFRVLEIILLPNLLSNCKNDIMKKCIYIFIVLWGGATMLKNLMNPHNFPYKIISLI